MPGSHRREKLLGNLRFRTGVDQLMRTAVTLWERKQVCKIQHNSFALNNLNLKKLTTKICVQPSLIVSSSFCKLCFLFSVCNPVEAQDDTATRHGYHLMKCCMSACQKMRINKATNGLACVTHKLYILKGAAHSQGLKRMSFSYNPEYPPDCIL